MTWPATARTPCAPWHGRQSLGQQLERRRFEGALLSTFVLGALALGGLVGLAGAAAVAHLLRAMLFGVSPLDPLAHGAAMLVLSAFALAASLVPALRAARSDPLLALRHE